MAHFYLLGGDYTPRPISRPTHSKEATPQDQLLEEKGATKISSYPTSVTLIFPVASRSTKAELLLQTGHPRSRVNKLEEWVIPRIAAVTIREAWGGQDAEWVHHLGATSACPVDLENTIRSHQKSK